jgi:MFS family permease
MRSVTLLCSQRFLPLFLTQALGALNDNLFKNALVVLVLFNLSPSGGTILVELSGGVFILPYALLSATAGRLADRMEKSRLIRLTKLGELCLMALAALGLLSGSVALMMAVLFGLGVQATFFGPVKYGILPNLLTEAELMAGNGLVEAGTFLGILAGTIAGGALISAPGGVEIVAAAGLVVALAGFISAWFIPAMPQAALAAAAPGLRIGWNIWQQTAELLRESRLQPVIWRCTLGISWFWVVGATILAAFPPLARDNLGADGHVVTLMLAAFSVGIGLGAILCARLLRGEVSARLVPYAALGLSVFICDFAHVAAIAGRLADIHAVLTSFAGVRMVADLTLLAVSGGIYSVPLYALIQERSEATHRSRMIACNNVLNAAAMVAAAAMTAVLSASGLAPSDILMVLAGVNLLVVVWMLRRRTQWEPRPRPL